MSDFADEMLRISKDKTRKNRVTPRPPEETQDNWPFTCGCRVQRDADVGLMRVDLVVFCRLHEAAPRLLTALEEGRVYVMSMGHRSSNRRQWNEHVKALLQESRQEKLK